MIQIAQLYFINDESAEQIRQIHTDMADYYLSITRGDLLLICETVENVTQRFKIMWDTVLADLAFKAISVVYADGYITWDDTQIIIRDDDISSYDYGSETEEVWPPEGPEIIEFVYKTQFHYSKCSMNCPVCYDDFNSTIMSLCNHSVCTSCLKSMHESNLFTCPICRSDVFKWPIAIAMGAKII